MATDEDKSIGYIVCHGRPQRKLVYNICKDHLRKNSTIIGDIDTSIAYTAEKMNLKRIMYKSNTYEAYENLEPVDQLCARFKFFIDKHRGFKKKFLKITLTYLYLSIMRKKLKKTCIKSL